MPTDLSLLLRPCKAAVLAPYELLRRTTDQHLLSNHMFHFPSFQRTLIAL